MTFEQATRFESKSATAAEQSNPLGSEALGLMFGDKNRKSAGDKVAIGTCPECNPPFEWPPNEPKKPIEPKPERPKDK
ncbi:MAG: hypothetical protein K2X77_24895 [Candidatus Obscuribacterales bacterium]|jgi:hypothetical protein|nr:hypothetical protein [Candidatus Obscuribacterales bacterium]